MGSARTRRCRYICRRTSFGSARKPCLANCGGPWSAVAAGADDDDDDDASTTDSREPRDGGFRGEDGAGAAPPPLSTFPLASLPPPLTATVGLGLELELELEDGAALDRVGGLMLELEEVDVVALASVGAVGAEWVLLKFARSSMLASTCPSVCSIDCTGMSHGAVKLGVVAGVGGRCTGL